MHVQNRVNDHVDGKLGAPEDDSYRVNQEGRVVGDEHDDSVRRLEPIALRVRVEDSYQRLCGGPALRSEGEMIHRGFREDRGGSFSQILLADSTEVGADKALLQVALCLGGFAGSGRRLGDPLYERDSRRGNAVQKTAVFGSYLRVHINCLSEDLG
jgi:hypothetical protein